MDRRTPIAVLATLALFCFSSVHADEARIDRRALVTRHNPSFTTIDPSSPIMVGNGDIAFTVDITGLQTFESEYSSLVPLMTQAQWAWHSFPNPRGYTLEDALVPIDVRGQTRRYAYLADWSQTEKPAIAWLRENPHRFSLGRVSLHLLSKSGAPAAFSDISDTHQRLDMWSGTLTSRFTFEGREVAVETRVHPQLDMLIVTLTSELLEERRLAIDLKFPGVAAQLNPNPADWDHPDRHRTTMTEARPREIAFARELDATRYYVRASADVDIASARVGRHHYRLTPKAKTRTLTYLVSFSQSAQPTTFPSPAEARDAVAAHWARYWEGGGAIDLSGSTDPRANELERRIVQSQYLMALNAAGTVPPQEEGLFSNSWNGKFHLEMHLWHAAHFAAWGRTELLERSMPWYLEHLPRAKERARAQGVKGAWWPKMVGPEGRESPSTVNPFILWQQPHPIYLAELIYRDRPTRETLMRYRDVVFETADLLASIMHFDENRGEYVLGPPIIPAQEVFPPLTTFNPTFELEYYRFGLQTAQAWRERLGLGRNAEWDRVIEARAPLPQRDGLYLAAESFPEQWQQARSPACSNGHTAPACWNRDHPSFLAALGLLPGETVDAAAMRRTLRAVEAHWDLRQTWGWDFPMIAMTAARLGEPDKAIDFLFFDAKNNQFGRTGMTPRVHLDAHAEHAVPTSSMNVGTDGPGYRRAAETYFPSNGSLLLATALMAAGWDGSEGHAPGFPKDGKWVVKVEGIKPLP